MTSNADEARALFEQGFNCAQSVLVACSEPYGLDPETALRVAAGFGGGMGSMGETCGAVTGAFMVIGLKLGATGPKNARARERVIGKVRAFAERFRERCDHVLCRDLIGCDLITEEGRQKARDTGITESLCPKLVHAADILAEVLASSD